jgi:hypothetical protein
VVLSVILLIELVYVLTGSSPVSAGKVVDPQQVGISLFSTYLIGVELVSVLLLASLVGAYHLGRPRRTLEETKREEVRVTREEFMAGKFPVAGPKSEGGVGEYEMEKEH